MSSFENDVKPCRTTASGSSKHNKPCWTNVSGSLRHEGDRVFHFRLGSSSNNDCQMGHETSKSISYTCTAEELRSFLKHRSVTARRLPFRGDPGRKSSEALARSPNDGQGLALHPVLRERNNSVQSEGTHNATPGGNDMPGAVARSSSLSCRASFSIANSNINNFNGHDDDHPHQVFGAGPRPGPTNRATHPTALPNKELRDAMAGGSTSDHKPLDAIGLYYENVQQTTASMANTNADWNNLVEEEPEGLADNGRGRHDGQQDVSRNPDLDEDVDGHVDAEDRDVEFLDLKMRLDIEQVAPEYEMVIRPVNPHGFRVGTSAMLNTHCGRKLSNMGVFAVLIGLFWVTYVWNMFSGTPAKDAAQNQVDDPHNFGVHGSGPKKKIVDPNLPDDCKDKWLYNVAATSVQMVLMASCLFLLAHHCNALLFLETCKRSTLDVCMVGFCCVRCWIALFLNELVCGGLRHSILTSGLPYAWALVGIFMMIVAQDSLLVADRRWKLFLLAGILVPFFFYLAVICRISKRAWPMPTKMWSDAAIVEMNILTAPAREQCAAASATIVLLCTKCIYTVYTRNRDFSFIRFAGRLEWLHMVTQERIEDRDPHLVQELLRKEREKQLHWYDYSSSAFWVLVSVLQNGVLGVSSVATTIYAQTSTAVTSMFLQQEAQQRQRCSSGGPPGGGV